MNIITLGIGPGALLTGLVLTGLTPAEATETTCTSVISYDFTAASAPFYPVSDQPGYWHTDVWIPDTGKPAPEAGFPNLVMAFGAEIIAGELSYLDSNPRQAGGIFGDATVGAGTGALDTLFDTYGGTRKIYAEVTANFHAEIFEEMLDEPATLVTVFPESIFWLSFKLEVHDDDGPPAGDLVFKLTYCSGARTTVTVATKPRTFADGLHTFRVEMTPSTPQVPGSTTNFTLNANGVARVYIDDVLEYESTTLEFRPREAPVSNINDAYIVGGVAVGYRGFVGGYTALDFGYCDVEEEDPEEPPIPPEPGGELPEPVEPTESEAPTGVVRIFALLTYGDGSPFSELAVAEVDLNDPDSWYGGYKAPWLLEVSTITRELSDALRGVDVTLTLADPARTFRTLAETNTLGGATWEIFLVSDTVRYALGEPYRRFAGRVHSHKALPGMRYEFTIRDILSDELADLFDTPRVPPERLTLAKFAGMTADYENRAIPIVIGDVSDEDSDNPQGVVPPLIVAPAMNLSFFGGADVAVVGAILSHGALPPYFTIQGYYNTTTNPYVRIPIPDSAWGTILTAPGQPGWEYVGVATDYVDYPADPTLKHRLTPVFFLASHPDVQALVDGRVQVAFNVFGLTENADGSGRYFEDAPDIYEFLIRNWLYTPHWRYGDYNGTPTFSRGYTIVNHDSVVRSRTRLQALLGSPTNYPVGFLLGADGQQQTMRHVLTELCHGVLMEQGFDRHGRILLDVEDVDAEATLALSDLHDIEDGEFEIWIDRSEYANTAEYVFGRRYLPAVAPLPAPAEGETLPPANVGAHKDWSAVGTYLHDDAIAANQGRETPPLQLENWVVRNSDVAVNWVERQIARRVGPGPAYDGQRMFRLTTSWQALEVELGDVIAIDHVDGVGASFVGQRGRVLKITDDLQRNRIVLEGRLLYSEGSPS